MNGDDRRNPGLDSRAQRRPSENRDKSAVNVDSVNIVCHQLANALANVSGDGKSGGQVHCQALNRNAIVRLARNHRAALLGRSGGNDYGILAGGTLSLTQAPDLELDATSSR